MNFPQLTHIIVTRPVQPRQPNLLCQVCTRQPPADVTVRIEWPYDDRLANFHNVYMCNDCVRSIAKRLFAMLPPEEPYQCVYSGCEYDAEPESNYCKLHTPFLS